MLILPHLKGLPAGNAGSNTFKSAALDLNFSTTKSLVDSVSGNNLVSFTRASTATFVGSDGLIKTAATNEPRFDHNPTTGESLGLLVEEARTNSILQSQDFSTTWTNTGSSENTNVVVAPDGTQTADALVDTAISEPHNFTQTVSGLAASTSYTFSCFMKKGSKNYGVLVFAPNTSWGSGAGASVFFDLNNGTVGTAANATGTIQALPNGWYRCTATATTTITPGTVTMRIGSSLTGSAQTYTGAGDEAIYLWGAQLEAGAFPTSYIPTTTATVTRAADVASITGSNFSSFYNQTEGTMFAEGAVPVGSSGQRSLVSIDDNTTAERIQIGHNGTTAMSTVVVDGGTTQFAPSVVGGSFPPGEYRKLAVAVKAADFAAITTPGTTATGSSGTMPTPTQLQIGFGPSRTQPNSPIKRITYWPVRLPNTSLQAITQP